MRQSRYLNFILTANALLLSALLWTQVAGVGPIAAQQAAAQSGGSGIPNAASQRQQMIEAMREMRKSIDGTNKMIKDGKIKVQVTNLDELRLERQ